MPKEPESATAESAKHPSVAECAHCHAVIRLRHDRVWIHGNTLKQVCDLYAVPLSGTAQNAHAEPPARDGSAQCCPHDAERHGPEAGGCIECRCQVTHKGGNASDK